MCGKAKRKCVGLSVQRTKNAMISDGWTTDDLQYLWKTLEPVQIVRDLHLPRLTLEKYISDYCNIKTNTGKVYNQKMSLQN